VTYDDLPAGIDGRLTFATKAAGRRYVHVRLAQQMSGLRERATLGHELQHAVELADTPAIVDDASLAHAFRRFGIVRYGSKTARARTG
jgi:hypothetical protein